MSKTKIEWSDAVWNPTRGCSLVSPGCTNCYAMRQAHRFSGEGQPYHGLTTTRKKLGPVWTGEVRLDIDALYKPLQWRLPCRIFVNSMSDLFHERLTNKEIAAVFGVMAAAPQHTFQVLTKRAKHMREWFDWYEGSSGAGASSLDAKYEAASRLDGPIEKALSVAVDGPLDWPLANVWLGVSVENQKYADERIPELLQMPAAVRFVSYEPALGPVDFENYVHKAPNVDLKDDDWNQATAQNFQNAFGYPPDRRLDWVIVGGESGPGARPFNVLWARSVIGQCKRAGVPVFMKQLGAKPWQYGFRGEMIQYRSFDPREVDEGYDGYDIYVPALGPVKDRKGGDPAEWPEELRVRQWP